MDNTEGFKTSEEEATADAMEIAIKLEVEPKDVNEFLQSHY